MEIKKLISSSLIVSILFGNLSVRSLASILSNVDRYEIFEGNNIIVDDVLEEDNVDVEIEGNTLVNLVDYKKVYSNNGNVELIENGFNISGTSSNYINGRIKLTAIKPNTTYTLFSSKEKIILPENKQEPYIDVYNNDTYITSQWMHENVKTFTTGDNIEDFHLRFVITNNEGGTAKSAFKNIMLLEGDWSDKEVSPYFEGMKSVDEVNIVSSGKNLIDINNPTFMCYSYDLPFISSSEFVDEYSTSENSLSIKTIPNVWNIGVGGVFKVEKNSVYTVRYESATCDKDYEIAIRILGLYEDDLNSIYYHEDNYANYIGNAKLVTRNPSVTNVSASYDSKDYDYIAVYIGGRWSKSPNESRTITLNNVEFYKETGLSHDYQQYQAITKNLVFNSALKSLPNGVCDKIIYKNGKPYIERTLKEVILDGSNDENWVWGDNVVWKYKVPIPHYSYDYSEFGNGMSDKYLEVQDIIGSLDYAFKIQSGYIQIRNKDYADGNLDAWRSYLKDNPVRVIYQMSTPIYECIDENNVTIPLFRDLTYINVYSSIPVSLKVTVDRIINKSIEAIELAKTNQTLENLAIARMWVNMLDESTLKDELQQEISSITQVKDLEIDKKTATANLDIYIKNEDMLSMSLNTNSIVFDNYSAVESLENKDAVGIIISSSLPYDLNAYLESSISNSSKDNELDINILKIKESNKQDYNSFADIKEKLVLGEDYQAGSHINHNIDLKLEADNSVKSDTYKTTIRFEVVQK